MPAADAADKVLTSTGTSEGDYEWADAAGGIDLTSEREAQLIQGDGSGGWATGMALKVVQDLPADDDPNYAVGDAVFVLGDVDPKGELPGIGGWSDVTDLTGTGTKYEYTADGIDWSAFEWTASGSVTTTDGIVDALIVAAGGSAGGPANYTYMGYGGAGGVHVGAITVEGTSEVQVGVGTTNAGLQHESHSKIADAVAVAGGSGVTNDSAGANGTDGGCGGGSIGRMCLGIQGGNGAQGTRPAGGGAGGDANDTTAGPGLEFSYTGTPTMYAVGGSSTTPNTPNTGNGRGGTMSTSSRQPGSSGVVVIRVPRGNDKSGLPPGPFDTTTLREKIEDRKVKK